MVALPVLLAACATSPPPGGRDAAAASNAALRPPAAAPRDERAIAGPPSGQWQLVLEVDGVPGVSGRVPPQTMSLCSTPEDKKQWQDMVGGKSMAGCTVKDFLPEGPTIRYAIACAGGIEGRTIIRIADDDHYGGETTLTLTGGSQPAVIRSKVTATRLAPVCRK
jgi:hypothetical protein